jgi:hypothetical protein
MTAALHGAKAACTSTYHFTDRDNMSNALTTTNAVIRELFA